MPSEFNYINSFKKISQKSNNYLITGSSGTGKSYFLIQFVKYLIVEKKIKPGRILVFTFNRKISKYYREEISRAINESVSETPILTFYSFCLDFISRYRANIALEKSLKNVLANPDEKNENNFEKIFKKLTGEVNLLTAPEQWDLITSVLEDLDEKNYFYIISLLKGNNYTRASIIQEIFDYILRARENLLSPNYLSKKFTPYINELMSEINNIYCKYDEKINENDFYDYGRILQETVSILKNEKNIADLHKQNYEFVLVDDLQEVNSAGFEIIKSITDKNIIFFGNDDESIFTFRGSNITNYFRIYESLYPDNVIFLKNNFRNNHIINEISNTFIARNKNRVKKESKTHDGEGKCGEAVAASFNNLHEELNFILDKIYYLHSVKGIGFKNIAIILKGSEFETRIIENFLISNQIVYYLRNPRAILGSKYVKYILNISKLCVLISDRNKNNKQFSKAHGNKFNDALLNPIDLLVKNLLFSEFLNINPLFFKEIESAYLFDLIHGRYKNIWEFLVMNLRDFKRIDKNNYWILIKFIASISRYSKKINMNSFDFFADLFKDSRIGFQDKIKNYDRIDPVEKNLLKVLSDYLESVKNFSTDKSPQNTVRDYMDYIENLRNNQFTEEIEESTKDKNENDGIRIISFYESKNYEFEAVFIPFLNKGYFPSNFSKPQTYDPKIFQMFLENKYPEEEEIKRIHVEEERKILNMGITRAKNYLYITSNKYKSKSSFFEEISEDLKKCRESIKKESLKPKSTALTYQASGNQELTGGVIPFNYLKNKWMLKKKALVSTYRINKNIFADREKYNKYLVYLKKAYSPRDWWNLRAVTSNSLKPFDIYKNYFSYSSLESYDSCPFKYKHEYFFKIRNEEKKYSMLIGSIYHEIIRRFFKECVNYEISDLLRIVSEEIEAVKDQFEYDFYIEELKETGIKDFQNFYNFFITEVLAISQKNQEGEKLFCERKFEFELDSKEKITGKIDFINIIDGHSAEIIDFKSSSKKYSEKDFKEKLQLKIYKLGTKFAKTLNQDGLNLKNKEIILKYYFLGNEKEPLITVSPQYYDEGELVGRISKIISNIKDENFDIKPKNYMSCYYCDYKIFCEKYYGNQI